MSKNMNSNLSLSQAVENRKNNVSRRVKKRKYLSGNNKITRSILEVNCSKHSNQEDINFHKRAENVQARVPNSVKAGAMIILQRMGLSMSDAINLFMNHIVSCPEEPFINIEEWPSDNSIRTFDEPRNAVVQARVSASVKSKASAILEGENISMSHAITGFLVLMVEQNRLPFDINLTYKAICELENGQFRLSRAGMPDQTVGLKICNYKGG